MLVFLPGFAFKRSIWDKFRCHFEASMAIDLIEIRKQSTWQSIIANSDRQIPERSIIVAWSFGALIALSLCQQYPTKCKKLILIGASPKFNADVDWPGISSYQQAHFKLNHLLSNVQFPNRDVTIRHYLKQHLFETDKNLAQYLDYLFNLDLRKAYHQLSIPILHLLGTNDVIVPVDIRFRLQALNQNITVQTIPQAGHIPFLTHETITKRFITEFIRT